MSRWEYCALYKRRPFRKLKYKYLKTIIEVFFVEINLRKTRWLLCCCYKLHKSMINEDLNEISKGLDSYVSSYDYILIIRDFIRMSLKVQCMNFVVYQSKQFN